MGQSPSNAASEAAAAAATAAAEALYQGTEVVMNAISNGVEEATTVSIAREKARVEELSKELRELLSKKDSSPDFAIGRIVNGFVRKDDVKGLEAFLKKYIVVPWFRKYLNGAKPIAEEVARQKKDPAVYMPLVRMFEGWLDRSTFLFAVEYGHLAMLEWCFTQCSHSDHSHCFCRTVCWAFNGRDPVLEAARHGDLPCLKAFHKHGFVFEKTVKNEVETFISEMSDKIARFSKGWERQELRDEVQKWTIQTEKWKAILEWLSKIGASQ